MINEVMSLRKKIENKYPEQYSCWCEHLKIEEVLQSATEQEEKDDSSTIEILLFFQSFISESDNIL
jgi:hypothetical protein